MGKKEAVHIYKKSMGNIGPDCNVVTSFKTTDSTRKRKYLPFQVRYVIFFNSNPLFCPHLLSVSVLKAN